MWLTDMLMYTPVVILSAEGYVKYFNVVSLMAEGYVEKYS
jgi:hypothetical protein